jgi:hypothetical protein
MVLGLVVAAGGTAVAGKPDCGQDPTHPSCKDDPSAETGLYDMTMEFIGDADGLATTCGGPIRMEDGPHGLVAVDDSETVGDIQIRIEDSDDPLDNTRRYGTIPGVGLAGCHGPPPDVAGNESTHDGLLTIGADEGSFSLLWHFDYYQDFEPLNKNKMVWVVWENLSLRTPEGVNIPVVWDDQDGVRTADVTGNFELYRFLRDEQDDLGWFIQDTIIMSFRVTLTPVSG